MTGGRRSLRKRDDIETYHFAGFPMRLIFEIVTLSAIVLIAQLAPPTKSTRLGRVKQWYRSLARRPWLAMRFPVKRLLE